MEPNPFAALSLIVAPAILTNASSVLAMSTSNRLARAVDRGRELARQIEASGAMHATDAESARRRHELERTQYRGILLLRVLQSFYVALGGFASATLISLLGAVIATFAAPLLVSTFEILGVAAGVLAVGALVRGSTILIRETSIAVAVMQERARSALASVPPPSSRAQP